MECGKARAAAAEDDDGRMLAWELEAAEALAGMARCTVSHAPQHVISQDQPVAAERGCVYAPSKITTSPQKTERIVGHIPTQCSISHQSNPVMMKFRRKLTEAEKEERKLRHIMANRESARQTIRRRQAMHLELTKKAADVSEENENLKKQKELMMEDFNSLKDRNEFLKAQLAEAKKVAAGDTEEPNSPEAEKTCSASATAPIFLQNQPPSLYPCFWPQFQGASHPPPLQLPMPPADTLCLHQGHDHSAVMPLFIVPVPWLLPLLAHTTTSGINAHYCGTCSCSDARLSEDNNSQLLSNQNTRPEAYNPIQTMSADSDRRAHQPPAAIVVPGLFSPVQREPLRACQVGDIASHGFVSTHETVGDGLFLVDRGKPEDMVIATEARRRRKELMRLKNVNCK